MLDLREGKIFRKIQKHIRENKERGKKHKKKVKKINIKLIYDPFIFF